MLRMSTSNEREVLGVAAGKYGTYEHPRSKMCWAHHRISSHESKLSFDTLFLLSTVPPELVRRRRFIDLKRRGVTLYGLWPKIYCVFQGRVIALLTGILTATRSSV